MKLFSYLFFVLFYVSSYGQERSFEYIFDDKDSTYQLVKTTTYENGSFVSIGEVPIEAIQLEEYLFETANKVQNGIENVEDGIQVDSLELIIINDLLKENIGIDFQEKLEQKVFAEFQGKWSMRNGSTKIVETFRFANTRFRDESNDSYRVRIKSNNHFVLIDYNSQNWTFKRLTDRWIAKKDETKLILRQN